MSGEMQLEKLLESMQPNLIQGEFVFCSLRDANYQDLAAMQPLATYQEQEGMSVLLDRERADQHELEYSSVFRGITLAVHSSLDAVGFTAAVANHLAVRGIPANVIAACYHDHVFVPSDRAEEAMACLVELSVCSS